MKGFIRGYVQGSAMVLVFALAIYAVVMIIAICIGMMSRGIDDGCTSNRKRIELAMPGFRIGCWLMEDEDVDAARTDRAED